MLAFHHIAHPQMRHPRGRPFRQGAGCPREESFQGGNGSPEGP